MPVTIKTIAAKAGVTDMTVSRVLNNKDVYIKDSTREKILRTARELNYRPNRFAKSLRTGKTNIIGIAGGSSGLMLENQPYITSIYQGIGNHFRGSDYSLIFQNSVERDRVDPYKEWTSGGMVDGMIVLVFSYEWENFKKDRLPLLRKSGIPFVVIHSLQSDKDIPSVGVDCIMGGEIGTRHLVEHGYESIGFTGSSGRLLHGDNLFTGYRRVLEENGLVPEERFIYRTEHLDIEDGYALADRLIREKKDLPRALFAAAEGVAFGMIKRFYQAGIRVPEDMALIGFGNNRADGIDMTDLTCVSQPAREKGARAGQVLQYMLEGESDVMGSGLVLENPSLIVRKTCGCK